MTEISQIKWLEPPIKRVRQWLCVQCYVLEKLGIKFPKLEFDPVSTANEFLLGNIKREELEQMRESIWKIMEAEGISLRIDSDRSLRLRLALGILDASHSDIEYLNEALMWFEEFLIRLKYNKSVVSKLIFRGFEKVQ